VATVPLAAYTTQVSYDMSLEAYGSTQGVNNLNQFLIPANLMPMKQAPTVLLAARETAAHINGLIVGMAANCAVRGILTLFLITLAGDISSGGAGRHVNDADVKNWYGVMPKGTVHQLRSLLAPADQALLNTWATAGGNDGVMSAYMIGRLTHHGLMGMIAPSPFTLWMANNNYIHAGTTANSVVNWATVFTALVTAHMAMLHSAPILPANDLGPRGAANAAAIIPGFVRAGHVWMVGEEREGDALNNAFRPFEAEVTTNAMIVRLAAVQAQFTC